MRTIYPGKAGNLWTYKCAGEHDHGGRVCWMVSGQPIDAAVEDLRLRMIVPSELELSLAVEREVDAQCASLEQQWKLRLEQADYEARRAERRYKAVDPDNRVVARTLESEWEARLEELAEIPRRLENAKRERRVQLTGDDRNRIRALARDLPAVWRAPTTTPADRKAMLRLVVEAIAIRPTFIVPLTTSPESARSNSVHPESDTHSNPAGNPTGSEGLNSPVSERHSRHPA